MKQEINIVWFKRDLRFTDHEALFNAQQQKLPVLLLYFFEPSMMAYPDWDLRHGRFVYESLQEMRSKLDGIGAELYVFQNEMLSVFDQQVYACELGKIILRLMSIWKARANSPAILFGLTEKKVPFGKKESVS